MIKGIHTDSEINNQSPEFAIHLKNVLLTEKQGSPINVPGFTVSVGASDIPYDVNGVYVIDEAIVLWSTDNSNSEIGLVENNIYKTIVNDSNFTNAKLEFSTNFPIEGQHYVNFNSERIIAWIDDLNEPRILNIDNFKVQQLNDIRIFPFANTPDLTFKVKDSGGSLESGVHQIVVAYANSNGLKTNWFSLGKPISITNDPLTIGFTQYDGVEAGTITSKAIEIGVENADIRFNLLRIGVVKTINSIVTAQFIKEIPIVGASFTTIYTGSEGTIETLTLEEILVPSASYKNAKAIGQVNNKLYLANLTVDEEIDLSAVANNTILKWKADISTAANSLEKGRSNKNPDNEVGFWPGEVYAFYLVGEKTDGTFTKAFHIPGREAVETGISVPGNSNTGDKDFSPAGATGKLTGDPLNYEVDSTVKGITLSGAIYTGDFGYWENKNEVYPTEIPVVINKVVSAELIEEPISWDIVVRIDGSQATPIQDPTQDFYTVFLDSYSIKLIPAPLVPIINFPMLDKVIESNNTHVNFKILNTVINTANIGAYFLPPLGAGYSGSASILSEVAVYTINYIYLDFPSGSTFNEFPKVGENITLTNFTAGNGIYKVLTLKQEGNKLKLTLENSDSIIGVGDISYSYIEQSTNTGLSGPVRHHRFPTLYKLRELNFSAFIGKALFPRLSLKAENVIIPPELQDKIVKWTITWAKRTPANATVMGQAPYQYAGCLFDNHNASPTGTLGKAFCSNVSNSVIDRNVLDRQAIYPHQQIIKFTSPELILGRPSIGSLYLRQEVKLKNTTAYQDLTSIQGPGTAESGVYENPSSGEKVWAFLNCIEDYTAEITAKDSLLREVEDYSYELSNTKIPSSLGLGSDLRTGDGSLFLKVKGGQPISTSIGEYIINPDPNGIIGVDINIEHKLGYNSTSPGTGEETFLSTLCQRKDNVYTPFAEQTQILTDKKVLSSLTTGLFNGGDCRNVTTGIKQIAPTNSTDTALNTYADTSKIGEGVLLIRYLGFYSTKNIGLRYSSNSVPSSVYYPKALDFFNGIFKIASPGDFRSILYNEDYTLVNEYNSIAAYNPSTIPFATLLPHTVASSTTNRLEERAISWQTFLSADRYVMPRDKGPIINLQGIANDRLFIHQRDSLFMTRSTTTIKADITDITLGSGDLFSVTPTEVLSTNEGFGGTQHKFSCKLTKAGYAFTDAAQGKIFLHNGQQLDEISNKGQRVFFRDNINKELPDNPFIGTGISISFDEKYNLLIMGYREGSTSYTAKYSPALEAWGGYDDYFPDLLFHTRKKMYSLKNNSTLINGRGIYIHNTGAFGVYYNVIEDNPIPYPLIIDVVYNPEPYSNKIFTSIEWASEVIEDNGVQLREETIDYITLSNNTKTTGRVELEKLVNLAQIHSTNTRNVNEFWSFNAIRDIAIPQVPFKLGFYDNFEIIDTNLDYSKPWYRKAKFIDRFLIARFEYSNLFNKKFSLLAHSPIFRKSYR